MSKKMFLLLTLTLVFASCNNKKNRQEVENEATKETSLLANNMLTEKEKKEGWQLLFDGKTINGWHLYNRPNVKTIWNAVDGVLECNPLKGEGENGDLVTDQVFENFEFTFEWQLNESGNSGVFINVQENAEFNAAWFTGPEYQLLDSRNKDFEIAEKRSGCLYGFSSQITETPTKPLGEWNFSRIKQNNGKVEFYLNGNLTGQVDFNSDEWKTNVASSGFKNFPQFGVSSKGRLTLQQWTSPVWFRNLKIKEL